VDPLREAQGCSDEDASVRACRSGHDLADLGGLDMSMRTPMWLRIVIVIVIGLALVTTWLTVFDTRIWPKEAHAVVCEDTYCDHPRASRTLDRKYQRDKMWKSNERSIEWVVSKPARRKIIKAYKRYTASHSYSEASPALVVLNQGRLIT